MSRIKIFSFVLLVAVFLQGCSLVQKIMHAGEDVNRTIVDTTTE